MWLLSRAAGRPSEFGRGPDLLRLSDLGIGWM
jgi:hypothetical protein